MQMQLGKIAIFVLISAHAVAGAEANHCQQAMTVEITNDLTGAKQALLFKENTGASYSVHVRSQVDSDFELKAEYPPAASLTVAKGKDEQTLRLQWQPTSSDQGEMLVLHYTSKSCPADVVQNLNLIVQADEQEPSLSFRDLPQTPLDPKDNITFHVDITDPNAAQANAAPLVSTDGSPTVQCESAPRLVSASEFRLTCHFDASKVPTDAKGDASPERIVESPFALKVTSRDSEEHASQLLTAVVRVRPTILKSTRLLPAAMRLPPSGPVAAAGGIPESKPVPAGMGQAAVMTPAQAPQTEVRRVVVGSAGVTPTGSNTNTPDDRRDNHDKAAPPPPTVGFGGAGYSGGGGAAGGAGGTGGTIPSGGGDMNAAGGSTATQQHEHGGGGATGASTTQGQPAPGTPGAISGEGNDPYADPYAAYGGYGGGGGGAPIPTRPLVQRTQVIVQNMPTIAQPVPGKQPTLIPTQAAPTTRAGFVAPAAPVRSVVRPAPVSKVSRVKRKTRSAPRPKSV